MSGAARRISPLPHSTPQVIIELSTCDEAHGCLHLLRSHEVTSVSPSVRVYAVSITLLFAAGFFELSFNTMAQALVQLNAPTDIRGRVVGLFNTAGLGMRAFSGITVGLLGAAIGIHWSLGLSAAVLLAFLLVLDRRVANSG